MKTLITILFLFSNLSFADESGLEKNILVYVVWDTDGIATSSQEFNSKKTCEKALRKLKEKQIIKKGYCVEK